MKPRDTDTQLEPAGSGGEATGSAELTPDQRARRTLMKLAVYVPPAVIGSLLVARTTYAATSPSCGPAQCGPVCRPLCGPSQCKPVLGP